MEIKIKARHITGIILGVLILVIDIYFFITEGDNRLFRPLIVVAFVVAGVNFLMDFLKENKRQKELELNFLEFVRSLVETVRSGVPIPSAVIQISDANYGSLTPYIKKLAHQLEWGYPLHQALTIFANNTKNTVIKRSVAIVIQAEKSGGDMGIVLQAVTNSVIEVKNIKEERKTNAYSQIVQGYIIFFVFIAIMLILQIYLLPKLDVITKDVLSGLGGAGVGFAGSSGKPIDFNNIFIGLVLIQGFFAGLMIGKFSEGDLKAGIKHSIFMMVLGYIIITTAIGVKDKEIVASIILLMGKNLFYNTKCKKEVLVI